MRIQFPQDDNFAADIREAVGDEEVEAVVIGEQDRYNLHDDPRNNIDPELIGKPIPLEQALQWLDYKFDAGFGGEDCHPIYIWTPTRVLFVSEYDGSTRIDDVPRHPVDCEPRMA